MTKIELTVDPEMCQGSQQCSHIAPAVFTHEDDGTAVVIDPNGASVDDLLEAAQMCPNLAITLVVDDVILHEGL